MTIEQKAKAYDKALERARALYSQGAPDSLTLESMFPELAESEDERIRKEIKDIFCSLGEGKIPVSINFADIFDWLEKQSGQEDEENGDFTIYYPLKNGKGEYECIPYSFYGTLTSFSEDSDLINFLRNCFYTEEECKEWIEKQGGQKPMWIEEDEDSNINDETNAPTEYGKYVDECLNEASKHFFSEGEDTYSVADLFYAGVRCGKSWFEKQDEQKSSTEVKPKFKVGDFIVNDYCMGRVVELTNDAYLLDTEQGIPFSCEHNVHLWTIQDAKDGDIIYIKRHKNNSEWLLIFKKIKSQNNFIDVYDYYAFSISTDNVYHDFNGCWGLLYDGDIVRPVTKEQCNLLLQKMKEEGYEWDAEKKELKLLITNGGDYCQENCKGFQETGKCYADGDCEAKKLAETTWSKEDEYVYNEILSRVANKTIYQHDLEYIYTWLKSLKERIQPQTTWKPSDEQMEALADALSLAKNCGEERAFDLRTLYEQLQKIKENKL